MRNYELLIVEDDRQLAELMEMSFRQEKFSVRAAYNGEDALREVRAKKPDLLILDVVMPGLTGWEVLKELKSDPATSAIPVIMCTGRDSIGDVEKSFNFGAQAYIVKPIAFPKLLRKVAAVLDIEELMHG